MDSWFEKLTDNELNFWVSYVCIKARYVRIMCMPEHVCEIFFIHVCHSRPTLDVIPSLTFRGLAAVVVISLLSKGRGYREAGALPSQEQ